MGVSQPLIQIVDETDNPVGESSITDARLQGSWHRVVRTVVEDTQGMVLLQKRAPTMHDFPNCWDSASAGHVDTGESYEIAARRELFEEIGLRYVNDLHELGYQKVARTVGDEIINRFEKIYKIVIEHTDNFSIQATEVSAVQWFTVDEIQAMIRDHPETVTYGLRKIMHNYYS